MEGHTRLGKKVRPYLKNNQCTKVGGVAQVVAPLPRKCEALSSTSSTTKKQTNKQVKEDK
jgi:hypothetical protein